MMRWAKPLVLLFILLACLDWWQARSLLKGKLPESMRQMPFETLDGHAALTWSRERYTVLYVFSPFCYVCKWNAINLNSLLARNLHVVSLVLNYQKPDEVQSFVRDSGLKAPVLLGNNISREELGVQTYPSYLLINPRGQVVRAWTGYTSTLGLYIKLTALRLLQRDVSI